MAKLILTNNSTSLSYPVISDSYANLENTLDIWIKFTGYLKPEELLFYDGLKDRDITSFQQTELDEYYRIRKQLSVSKLLVKYKNQDCTQEEHYQVVEFMKTSLKSFVKSRLSEEEKELASRYISELELKEQIKEYIESQQEMYDNLSIYDAYVLFQAKERLYYLEQKKLNEKIRIERIGKAASLKKSLIRDYGHKF